MNAQRFTPSTAARLLGVAPNTVRTWCTRFSGQMSAGANPPPGVNRILLPSDVAVLQAVKGFIEDGVPVDDIAARLQELSPAELQQPSVDAASPFDSTAQETPGTAIALAQVQTVMQPVFDAMAARLANVEQTQRDMAEQQKREQADARRLAVLWYLAGVLTVAGIGVLLALVVGQ